MSDYLSSEQVTQLVIWTPSGCWEWTGTHTQAGYGRLRGEYLHRLMYEKYVGPIPEGLEIDHLCRNRGCCNPLHLEAVTHAENMRRGYWGAKTHCPRGHGYTPENSLINSVNGGRQCKSCISERKKREYRTKNPLDKSQASRTHCPKGHPFAGENLYRYPDGRRGCRTCKKEQGRASYLRTKEKAS